MGPFSTKGRHLMFREYGPADDFRPALPLTEPASFSPAPESKRRSPRPPESGAIDEERLGEPKDHDALADLFLGELGQVAARDAAMGVTPWAPRHPACDRADRQDGPLVRNARTPEGEPPRRAPRRVEMAVDNVKPHPVEAMLPRSLTFEALVLGHLPVMGSAWAHQYARSRSRLNGDRLDIAMVRCVDGHARVDLSVRTQFGVDDIPGHVARAVSHVVVFGDSHNEQAIIASGHVGRVTILCGADEAGIVDAYRTLKALSDTRDWSKGAFRLGVAIMGASGARAATAFARLRDSAQRFLGITIDHAGQFERIEGGPAMHTIGTMPFRIGGGGPAEILRTLADATAKVIQRAAGDAAAEMPLNEGLQRPTHPPASAGPDQTHEPMAERMSPHTDDGPTPPRQSSANERGPDVDLSASRDTGMIRRGPSLIAAHFPDLTPLAARCPFADDIELAVDADGGLHVLGAAHGQGSADATVTRITAVLGWAKANRSVLALTLPPGRGLDRARMPVGHFVTTEPAAHRTLLDSTLCIHVLAPVVKTVSSDWVIVALN